MKALKNIGIILSISIFSLCFTTAKAQSCKQAFYSAQEQYNGGQFQSAQGLLNTCLEAFNANKAHYQGNPDQVFKVYKLYIESCIKSNNSACGNAKRQDLTNFFAGKFSRDEVINKLNGTPI